MRALALAFVVAWSIEAVAYDYVIRGGTVFDGSGNPPYEADIAVEDDKIVAIGAIDADGETIDARGLAVAPGFINMLSFPTSLLYDGRSLSNIHQGVTLEIFGEGNSLGPLTPEMKEAIRKRQSDFKYDIPWSGFGAGLEHLVAQGVAPNVASFIGATTVRIHELGRADRAPDATTLERMQNLVRDAMREGALGVGSSLIYAPAFYADTAELIALAAAAAEFDGMYISHMRSEGARINEAVAELVAIARATGIRAEIWHLKLGGQENWPKFDSVIEQIRNARSDGLRITANMYTYTAGSTGLDAAMPPWVQEGGYEAWRQRLRDPETRKRVAAEMIAPQNNWENLMRSATPEGTLLVGFANENLRQHTGKTLAQVAAERAEPAHEVAIDLVIEDGSRVQVIYFLMSEDHVRQIVALPWVSFGSDASPLAPEGLFLNRSTHPRAYGNFARLLGKYVREERVLPLQAAIHKLTKLPATNLKLADRGELRVGHYADIVVFDPATVGDRATYDEPHQLAVGMQHVLVNGTLVLHDGEHTGALPGRFLRGPGWSGL